MKIAVTGHIAAGKSTVMAMLKKIARDYEFESADSVASEVRERKAVQEMLMNEHGTLEPSELRKYVGTSVSLSMVTSLIEDRIKSDLQRNDKIIIEVPTLLKGKVLPALFDYVIFITAKEETRVERMRQRGYDQLSIDTFLEAQRDMFNDKRIDYIIENDGDESELREACTGIMTEIKASANNK